MPSRYFVVRKAREADGEKPEVQPAFLEIEDATDEQQADYMKARQKAVAGNKGLVLDTIRSKAIAELIWAFTLARVVKAHGFLEGVTLLEWATSRDAILAQIPIGLKNLLRTTVFALNFPDDLKEYERASAIAQEEFPN